MSVDLHPGWGSLIKWLASQGMDTSPTGLLVEPRRSNGAGYGLYALSSISPSTLLFSVPASALLNKRTLAPHYPSADSLTAIQVISLHLFLHRPIDDVNGSSDPLFGPYISILPREFDDHPLTWLVKDQMTCSEAKEKQLLSYIPRSVMYCLVEMVDKFKTDWTICSRYLRHNSANLAHVFKLRSEDCREDAPPLDYLWAWLNVNTRCIFHRLKERRSDPDNMTLCPILDFANHSSRHPSMTPYASEADIWDKPSSKRYGCDFGLSSPFEHSVDEGEEVFLRYGMHSSRTLFTEYGFVESGSELDGGPSGEVDLTIFMSELFSAKGDRGHWMKERLVEEGYWGQVFVSVADLSYSDELETGPYTIYQHQPIPHTGS
ncbi:SET domain-containing protein [Pluteus cervinus]|uniref:SET domain-containing protein n=1 Tax=Pluteus cervinus TaxID=181527 RepID=A0ACD3BHG3_9AGAR|nr:SET domain-containing protein [Pluteus cervinus]